MKELLTIGIPTYNRSHYLKDCLSSICSQLTDEVKVVVRDNNSNNYDFDEFIKPYVESYNIIAERNVINIGGDANTARLFECCDTPWLWVIGDDDCLLDNIIPDVLSIIKSNSNSIYIKLNSDKNIVTKGLSEFANALKAKSAFGASFFTSECLYNVATSKDDMFWHYRYLSTYNPQILRVLKHLTKKEDSECTFTSLKVLQTQGSDVTWGRVDIVPYQAVIFDLFYDYRSILKNNVFKDIFRYCFVYTEASSLPFKQKIKYYRTFILKYGIINSFRYNSYQIFRVAFKTMFGDFVYKLAKKIFTR